MVPGMQVNTSGTRGRLSRLMVVIDQIKAVVEKIKETKKCCMFATVVNSNSINEIP
jgi:hypothetical protein